MKQTVKEAAIEYCNGYFPDQEFTDRYTLGKRAGYIRGFKQGVEWQSKQSPWISVEERLPQPNEKIIIITISCEHIYTAVIDEDKDIYVYNADEETPHYYCNVEDGYVTHYMLIPTFDQILEANKDVLQRIKEKGD